MPLPHQLTANRASLEEFSRTRAMGVPHGAHRILCRMLGEFPLLVHVDDLQVDPRLVLDGFWEAWVTLALARHVQEGMYCVDVGANYGYYTRLMEAAAGSEGRILACDPLPLCAERHLPETLQMNGMADRGDIRRVAVGDREAPEAEVLFDRVHCGSSDLPDAMGAAPEPTAPHVMLCRAPMTTLDALLADWPRIDLVKIDVEGAESWAWEGMQQTLRRFPQVAVVAELHLAAHPQRALAWLHRVERMDYPLRHISYDGDVVPVHSATILAHPKEHWMLWLQR